MEHQTKQKESSAFRHRFKKHFQTKMMNGLIKIAPILITLVVIFVLVGYADSFFRPMFFVSGTPWDRTGIGVVLGIALLYGSGWLVSSDMGVKALRKVENITRKLPFVGAVFNVAHQIVSSFTSQQYSFTRVVFIEWPRPKFIAIGFVTGRAYNKSTGQALVVVYIPTVPNPTSGNLAFVDEDEIVETNLTAEEAMRLVFSGGISIPEDFALARVPPENDSARFDMLGAYTLDFKNVEGNGRQ